MVSSVNTTGTVNFAAAAKAQAEKSGKTLSAEQQQKLDGLKSTYTSNKAQIDETYQKRDLSAGEIAGALGEGAASLVTTAMQNPWQTAAIVGAGVATVAFAPVVLGAVGIAGVTSAGVATFLAGAGAVAGTVQAGAGVVKTTTAQTADEKLEGLKTTGAGAATAVTSGLGLKFARGANAAKATSTTAAPAAPTTPTVSPQIQNALLQRGIVVDSQGKVLHGVNPVKQTFASLFSRPSKTTPQPAVTPAPTSPPAGGGGNPPVTQAVPPAKIGRSGQMNHYVQPKDTDSGFAAFSKRANEIEYSAKNGFLPDEQLIYNTRTNNPTSEVKNPNFSEFKYRTAQTSQGIKTAWNNALNKGWQRHNAATTHTAKLLNNQSAAEVAAALAQQGVTDPGVLNAVHFVNAYLQTMV